MSVKFNDEYHGFIFNSPHWKERPLRDLSSLELRSYLVREAWLNKNKLTRLVKLTAIPAIAEGAVSDHVRKS
jgi:hypothetical protein